MDSCHQGRAAQYWQCICMHIEAKTFGQWPAVKKGSKEDTSLQEKLPGQIEILHTQRLDSIVQLFSLMTFRISRKSIDPRRKGERYHESCDLSVLTILSTLHKQFGCYFSIFHVGWGSKFNQ